MKITKSMTKRVLCAAMLGVGCVNEPSTLDEAPEALDGIEGRDRITQLDDVEEFAYDEYVEIDEDEPEPGALLAAAPAPYDPEMQELPEFGEFAADPAPVEGDTDELQEFGELAAEEAAGDPDAQDMPALEEFAAELAPVEGTNGATVVGVETLDVVLPASSHAQGIAVPAKMVRPKWSKAVGKQPAILVLHGSGGLLKTPKDKKGKQVCMSDMESQYKTWSDRLAKLGYTVLLPSSYSARGFCDKHDDVKRIPKTFDGKPEQILGRIYDTDVAARYLCTLPEVDCDRMGVMGFSQGGTMTMLAMHWQMEHAVQHFRSTKAKEIDFKIPDLKPGRPDFQVGVAYYPGCGFDGLVPLSTGKSAKKENKFMPTGPLTVLHGGKDPLVDHCSTKHGKGGRQVQSKEVSAELKIADQYNITVYSSADHGFDHNGDKKTQEAALAITLQQFANNLK